MYNELNLLEADGVLAAYNAVCELVEDTERLQAACAAKEAELAELRGQTSELFGARLEAEGIGEEAVTAAKAMWQRDPQSVALATLGCDIAEAANPYGCNQYGHGFKEPHGAAGGRGQKTFDFFDDVQDQKVVREQREIKKRFKDASDEVKKSYEDSREKAKELNRFHEETERRNNGRVWTEEEREHEKKLEDELMKADERSKTARRKQLEAARKAGKKVKPDFSDDDLGFIDDKLYDEFKDVFDDDDVKSSRTLEELLEEEEIVKSSHYDGYEIDEEVDAANPYGCNQYGHEWKGKHGEGWKPSGRGGASDKKEAAPEKKEDTQPKREAESPKEKSIEEEADEYEKGTDDDRFVTLRKWKREREEAKDKALDIRESTKYRQKDPEAIKAYEKAKDEANRRAKKIHEIIKTVAKRRGLSQRATDHMLRLYPETIIDF